MKLRQKIFSYVLLGVLGTVVGASKVSALTMTVFPENSRRSFVGALAAGNTEGSSLITIKGSGVISTDAGQLINGDNIFIGETSYVVATTSANLRSTEIALSSGLTAGNKDEDTAVIYKASGDVKITTSATVADGDGIFFYFKIGDATQSAKYNDGVPDIDGFDYNANATVTCPSGLTAAQAPADVDSVYHTFSCTNATGTEVTLTDAEVVIHDLINPIGTVASGEVTLIDLLAQQKTSGGTVSDTKMASMGFANAVKMTVRVAPQLTFKIEGLTAGTTTCGGPTDVTTTGTLVPFGAIDAATHTTAAQKLSVTTNAIGGYKVTSVSSDQMSLLGAGCAGTGLGNNYCIPGHGAGDTPATAPGTASAWSDASGRFGYTMEVVEGDTYLNGTTKNVTVAFADASANERAVADGWSAFSSKADAQNPVSIITNLRSTNGDAVNVCYRILADTSTATGTYQTSVTYTITASF